MSADLGEMAAEYASLFADNSRGGAACSGYIAGFRAAIELAAKTADVGEPGRLDHRFDHCCCEFIAAAIRRLASQP